MYRKDIESSVEAMQQHNDNMKANASRRLGDNAKNRKFTKPRAMCAPGRKIEARYQRRVNDYAHMLATAKPNEDHSGYHKPGSFSK